MGAALILYLPIGIAFSLTSFAASFAVDDVFNVQVGDGLALAALLGVAYPFAFSGQQLAQGSDRLHVSSIGSVIFQASFIAFLAFTVWASGGLGTTGALVTRSLAMLVAGTVVAAWLRPLFTRVRPLCEQIIREARDYGVHVYVGRLLSIGTYNMDVLLIGLWASADEVGYYALAAAIAGAAGLPVIAVSTALFARTAHQSRIDRRLVLGSAGVGTVLALVAMLLAGPFIRVVYSDRYADAIPLLAPLLAAQTVRGVTRVYNIFLSAHGRGRELRNAGLVLTASNLALNFALIPPYGATGAAWASLGALAINLVAHIVFYRRSLAEDV
jgi:O-antigen/teichoic acid export membrane protein